MSKRAIILTHGYGRAEQHVFRDRLIDGIAYYTDGFKKHIDPDTTNMQGYAARRVTATARSKGAPKIEIDIFEAYWADMIPAAAPLNPIRRVVRGFKLIAYWFFGGTARLFRRTNYLGFGLALSGVLLVVWYLSLLLVATKALIADPSALPAWLTEAVEAVRASKDLGSGRRSEGDAATLSLLQTVVSWIEATPWYGAIAAMCAGLPADRMAAVAEFSKAYLTDEKAGEAPAGVRARTKQRLVDLLETVYGMDEGYEEVFVIGHSIGAAIAVDALADYGDARARTWLFTWGSPLQVFSSQEPQVEKELALLLKATPPLVDWIDVILPNDWVAAKVPGHVERFGESKSIRATSPKGWFAGWNASSHEDYYRAPEALLPLIAPATIASAAASGDID